MSDRWVRSARGRENDGEESHHEIRRYSTGSGDEDFAPGEEGAPDYLGRLLGARCFRVHAHRGVSRAFAFHGARRRARKMIERFAEIYEVPVVWSPWRVHRWMDEFAGGVSLNNQEDAV